MSRINRQKKRRNFSRHHQSSARQQASSTSQLYSQTAAESAWKKSGSIFSSPAAAFRHWVTRTPQAKTALWKLWREAAQEYNTNEVVCILFSNIPGDSEDRIFAVPLSKRNTPLSMSLTQSTLQEFRRYFSVFAPDTFEAAGTNPPTFAIWFDGKKDGDYVSQSCLEIPDFILLN